MLAYVVAQPASFTFIISFLFITLSMPPMALYIKNAKELPDLDTMRSWNAYLGRLPSQRLCIEEQIENYTSTSTPSSGVASAWVDFYVSLEELKEDVTFLVGVLNGTQLKTQIRNSTSGKRIDNFVDVTIFISVDSAECVDTTNCNVSGCIDIRAPGEATPRRHPHIPHTDYTFQKRVLGSVNPPAGPPAGTSCSEHFQVENQTIQELTLEGSCNGVRPHREKYRKQGLITINLTEEQKKRSEACILLGTLGVAVIGLAFAVGIGCTERPPKPKNRPE
jgi:hypothetical protein